MMSMMTYINQNYPNLEVRFLYSTKVPSRETDPSEVLFLQDVLDLALSFSSQELGTGLKWAQMMVT